METNDSIVTPEDFKKNEEGEVKRKAPKTTSRKKVNLSKEPTGVDKELYQEIKQEAKQNEKFVSG